MAQDGRRGLAGLLVRGLMLAGVLVTGSMLAACGSTVEPDRAGPSGDGEPSARAPGQATVRPSSRLFGPAESFEPIEAPLTTGLPRSAEFLGVRFTVDAAHVTNTHPYTMFGEPRPGPLLFAVLDVTAENESGSATQYGFDADAFGLRTYSGQLLPIVKAPGRYRFSRLETGARGSDAIVFGTYQADILDGASLLIGRPPDAPAVIPLTAPQREPDLPTAVFPADAGPIQAAAIAWSVLGGEASLDRPAGVCCPDPGARADDGELFVTLRLSGLVHGSRYGQATVSSDALRLIVDGVAVKPFGFKGQANVAEGASYDLALTWLISGEARDLALEVGSGTPEARTVALAIGQPPVIETPTPSATPAPIGQPTPSSPGTSPISPGSPGVSPAADGTPGASASLPAP
jgi:hypothetical protein